MNVINIDELKQHIRNKDQEIEHLKREIKRKDQQLRALWKSEEKQKMRELGIKKKGKPYFRDD